MASTSRIDNSVRNVSFGLVLTAVGAIVSFVNRTFFVKYLGPDYLGLNGLFTEVIAVLSLAELGVGMAINYSLYKPIHDNDTKRISQLMALFRKSYNIICFAILGLGLIVLPFIHLIVTETDYPVSYIRLVFFLFLLNTAVSYLFSYNTSFVSANQRQYVISLVQMIAKVVFLGFSIVILVTTRNYILYLLLLIAQTLIMNVVVTIYVKRHFAFIDYSQSLPKEDARSVFRDIKNICIKRVSGVVTSSTANILISALVSTVQVGFYSNYTLFFSLVRTLKLQFSGGIKASIGDLSVTASPENCVLVLRRLTFLYFAFSCVICSVLLTCSSDIISLWLGSEYVMAKIIVTVAIYNLFMEIWSEPLWQYLEVSGLFRQDRNIAILGSVINLVVAFILGSMIGIVGIFLGTLCSQLIQLFLKTRLLFKEKFFLSANGFLMVIGKCIVSFLFILGIQLLCDRFVTFESPWISVIIKAIVSFVLSILVAILFFFRSDEFSYSIQLSKKLIGKWKKS